MKLSTLSKRVISLFLAAGIALSASVALAGGKHMFKELDLTDAQREQVKETRQQQKAAMKSIKQEMKALHERRATVLQNYSADSAAAFAEEAATLARKMMLQRLAGEKAVYDILDDSQKAKFLEMKNERMEKRGHHKGKKGEGRECDHDDDDME